jgi:hypothetical protein
LVTNPNAGADDDNTPFLPFLFLHTTNNHTPPATRAMKTRPPTATPIVAWVDHPPEVEEAEVPTSGPDGIPIAEGCGEGSSGVATPKDTCPDSAEGEVPVAVDRAARKLVKGPALGSITEGSVRAAAMIVVRAAP